MIAMKNLIERFKRLQAIAQAGLTYGKDAFDQERYAELHDIALSLLADAADRPLGLIEDLYQHETGYPTPKVDVRAFIRHGNTVLLVEDAKTKEWCLPGGYADVGLSPKANIQKEVLEETGLVVRVDALRAIYDTDLRPDIGQKGRQYYKLFFACTALSGEFQHNAETSNACYFTLDNLPALSLCRTTVEQLQQLFSIGDGCYFE